MHALLIPVGSAGDVHPFLGLGRGLLARGHRVTVATNSLFGAVAADLGMEFVEIGTREEFADAMKNPDLWHPTKGFPMIIREALIPLVPRIYEVIQRHYVPGDTFVVAGTLAFGARLAQEKLGVPLAMTHLSPSCLRSIHDFPALPRLSRPDLLPMWLRPWLWKLADLMIDRMMCPGLNAHRAAVGLPPVRRPMHEWMHSPLLTLGLFPDWFAAIQPDWPASMRLAGFPLYDERDAAPMSADVEAFLAAGAPPVAFTPGSAMLEGREFFAASMDACLRAGLRGVLLTRHGEQIPPNLPPSVRHFAFVPFGQLLPRCAAVVHHAGIGSSAQGLAAGIPQMVFDLGAFDQPDNIRRLKKLGVAASIPRAKYKGPAVAKALQALLADPALVARCKAVATKFHGFDPIGAACDAIEAAARRAGVKVAA